MKTAIDFARENDFPVIFARAEPQNKKLFDSAVKGMSAPKSCTPRASQIHEMIEPKEHEPITCSDIGSFQIQMLFIRGIHKRTKSLT